ncbi:hypothetical protein Taro_026244 [Colocasia esculenta]|uniref:JmjC domain-containing protein n=1 Tax=Colocasia esculenta TaxID=4460 RepID=A0A843VEM8_COLES|nr:hypothetical protein [Colocasia esculenta]
MRGEDSPEPPAGSVRLVTPALASERLAGLLQRITEEGGFAYVSSAEKAAGGDFRAAEAAREMAWEQLHSGPWHSVVPAWRDAYAMSCLHVAAFHAGAGNFREALKTLDMGLIMGGRLLRRDLDEAVEKIVGRSKGEEARVGAPASGLRLEEGDGDGCGKSQIVERQGSLSMERFLCDYFLRGIPVILTGCIDHWPARARWKDIQYLKGIAGDRTVPVEVGKNYLCDEWKQELITFSQFLERIHSTERCIADLTYLAQHPLFDQVVGRKYIRLYSASVSGELYPCEETMLKNSSQVDLDDLDLKKFPKVQDLEFVDCVLEEGEMLYVPPKWWHYVRSLTTSFSVSFWWSECKKPAS